MPASSSTAAAAPSGSLRRRRGRARSAGRVGGVPSVGPRSTGGRITVASAGASPSAAAAGRCSARASSTSCAVSPPTIVSWLSGGSKAAASSPSPSRNRITVMLSLPPLWFAARTSASAASSSDPAERRIELTSSSEIIEVRPSEQIRKTSSSRPASVYVSTSTSGSGPRARVMIDRCGWCSAASAVIWPLRSSSATSEWSRVSCWSSPPRRR